MKKLLIIALLLSLKLHATVVYDFPEASPVSDKYSVKVDGQSITPLQTKKGAILNFGMSDPVRIEVQLNEASKDVRFRPQSEGAARFDPVIQEVEGWTVHVDPQLLSAGKHHELGERALSMLGNHLERIAILLPAKQLAELRTCEIWLEHDHPGLTNMQYHPDEKWLIDNGHDPRLTKKVHITQAAELLSRSQMLKHPAVILHELAHAYHDTILGFDEPRILAAYEKAMDAGIYEKSLLYTGDYVKHYGASNHKEYFSESTEAYFYRNDFYPFVAAELKEHDPITYALIAEIWE